MRAQGEILETDAWRPSIQRQAADDDDVIYGWEKHHHHEHQWKAMLHDCAQPSTHFRTTAYQ